MKPTSIIQLALVLVTVFIINNSQAFKSDTQVITDLQYYIWAHSAGNNDFIHGQYGFTFYGELSGDYSPAKFSGVPLVAPANSYLTFDAYQFKYFYINQKATAQPNNIFIDLLPNQANKGANTYAPTMVLQTMFKEYDTPFHSESMGIKSLFYFTTGGFKPTVAPQPIRYLYTLHHPCSICSSKIKSPNFINSRASDAIRADIINGKGGTYPPPTTDVTYWIDSGESVNNLLYPANPVNDHLYMVFSRQWDSDYCHYFNVRQLVSQPGIQVVAAATNRFKVLKDNYQNILVDSLLGNSMVLNRNPVKGGNPVSVMFTFGTTSTDEYVWQYVVDQAYNYFTVNKMKNFKSTSNWIQFLKAGGYPEESIQTVILALNAAREEDCWWSQTIFRMVSGFDTSGQKIKKPMQIKRTLIPITHPFGNTVPTCKVATNKFPCVSTSPNFIPEKLSFPPACEIQVPDAWANVIFQSGLTPDEQKTTNKDDYVNKITAIYIKNFDRHYANRDAGDQVAQCASVNQ
ncbi:hypothetical protein DFA_11095 [Cavenderia fasciculata]|uniref:Uncharacterized protein n=1 Tax=Cavenderia fasciculata TaxID=261658 RepID=F4QES3_CACFS|nr:uncharacterized protein DFA_11095 [Cavenderia fasciculata]EGG13334.1 hypothetical protein DFA_11095 [Cavenderia fasciculata]|eukprot:XP_004350038.1 hypothetical protein DFA_11095 [Cavenderia fasciculata]